MPSRRQFLASAIALAAYISGQPTSGCLLGSQAAASVNPLRPLLDRVFDQMMQLDPTIATGLGLDTGERYALTSRLKTSGSNNRVGAQQALIDYLPQLRNFDRQGLKGADPYYLGSVIWAGERAAELSDIGYGTIDNWPMPYVLSQLSGSYQFVPEFLKQQHRITDADDANAYLCRLEDFARLISDECDMVEADTEYGILPPDFILDLTLSQTEALRAKRGRDSELVATLGRRAEEREITGDWSRRATRLVDGPIAAALSRQHALLTQLRKRATGEASLSLRKDGERFYAVALRTHITTSASAAEIHAIGVEQVSELTAKLDGLLRAQNMTRGTVAERLMAFNSHATQSFENDDEGRAEIVAYLERLLTDVRSKMPDYFNAIPNAPIEIRRMPIANELGAVSAYAVPGSLDGKRPGAFYINLHNTANWPKYSLPTLVYHEAIPGHLWNAALTQEMAAVPVINNYFYFAAYTEGWALYAEELAEQAGMYVNDAPGRIGLQQSLLLRAARIVADTGIHAMGWSRQQATEYMVAKVGLPFDRAQREVDRYCALPGQASGYKMGHNEMRRLLTRSQAKLGPRFNLKAWHDVVLSGAMPLEVLAGLLSDWELSV